MRDKTLFHKPCVLHRYASLDESDDSAETYQIIVLGAYYQTPPGLSPAVFVAAGNMTTKGFGLVDGTELVPEGPGYRFESGTGLFTIGPILPFHNIEFFFGIPMGVPTMEELSGTGYEFVIPVPGSPEAPIENLYIRKEDDTLLRRVDERWVKFGGDDSRVEMQAISGLNASIVAAAQTPITAQELNIPTASGEIQL